MKDKSNKKYRKHVRWLVLAIVFAVLMVIMLAVDGVIMGMGLYPTVNSYLHADSYKKVNPTSDEYYSSAYDSADALQEKEDSLCAQIEEEGAALLMNDGTLPLGTNAKVSLFSASSYDFIYGGTGSGEVNTDNAMTLQEALEETGMDVNQDLADKYEELDYHRSTPNATGGYSSDYLINEVPINKIISNSTADPIVQSFATYDTAIVTLSRSGGEGADLPYGNEVTGCAEGGPDSEGGDYLVLNQDEKDMLSAVDSYFDNVVILLNSSNPLQLDFLADYSISAVVWVGDVGQNGMQGVAGILAGTVNPSGRIVDTFLNDNHSSPAMQNFGVYEYSNEAALGLGTAQNNTDAGIGKLNSRYVVYEEGIYVGYRYYETRYEDYVMGTGNAGTYDYWSDVAYPFGSGLSYTDTSVSGATGTWDYSNYNVEDKGDTIEVSLTVTNGTGVAGKHTVQVYMQSPYTDYDKANGVEKASVELVGFDKTECIEAGGTAQVTISVDKSSLAAYDSNSAKTYIVDPGTYYFTAAHDAHEAVNNILAAKGYTPESTSSKMDAAGNADLAKTVTVDLDSNNCYTDGSNSYDANAVKSVNLTYSTSETTGVAITNQFDNADLNYYQDGAATYLTRSDWTGTFPTAVTGLAVNEAMWEDGLASDDSQAGPDGKTAGTDARQALISSAEGTFKDYYESKYSTTITEVPETGKDGDLQLYDLTTAWCDQDGNYIGISSEWNDTRWDVLLSQATYADMTNLIYNAFRQTVAIDSIGLPGTTNYNGPQGLTNAITNGESGMAYTSEDIMAATFNRELVKEMGECIGEDFLAADIAGIYGPGGNIHRTPYSGRNFEYYSEDGWLSGEIAAVEVQAISSKGVMVFMKHCVLNDQENGRYGLSTFANEQAIREIYLKPFEAAVKTGNGVGVMTSFNRIGVTWSGADFNFMTNVLREEFGMDGIAVTDCSMFAPSMDYRLGVLAGQNIWDGMSMGMAQLDGLDNDAVMVTAVREAVKHVAYTVSGSLAMNNIGVGTTIKTIMPGWAAGILAAGVVFAALVVLCVVMLMLSSIKAMRNRIADGVDKHGNPTKERK
ncbi:MAG: glycoside hydrolase family 3 C-terminal domain-containing protein [Clostridia bacterium]|nr:glycoside hydrolase family 3 C-terminal domain-containing protein [Clostridia bacterium]